jgi:hypothetical protein
MLNLTRGSMLAPLLALTVSACAAAVLPGQGAGPTLTISNEGDRALDLAYRCSESGPVRRLGVVPPRATDTFILTPAYCSTVHLVRRPLLGIDLHDPLAVTVVPLLGQSSVELVFARTGLLMRR